MKAVVLNQNDDLVYTEYETPEVGPGMVKIKVRVSGICGSDVPRVLYNGAHYYPIVLGHEFSGSIVEVGKGVERLKVGDHVAGVPRILCHKCEDCKTGNLAQCKNDSFIGSRQQGSFAEYIVVPECNAFQFDPSVPFNVAVFFEPATVALHGVQNIGYEGGQDVAIIGAGTIGNLTMQWSKIFGSRRTVVFDLDEQRLELAKKMGADVVINSSDDDCVQKAMELTGGRGFQTVFDVVGANTTLVMSLELAGAKGNISLIGTPPGDVAFTKGQWELINRKELWIRGCWQGYSSPFPGKEWELTAHYFKTGELKITQDFIHKTFPLSEAKQAFDMFKDPKQIHGKILLENRCGEV